MKNNIDNFTEEQIKESEDLTVELINRAKYGKHSKFIFIRSWPEYLAVREYLLSSKKVAKQFFVMWKKIMKDYLKDLKQGVSQLDLLLAAKNLNETAEFYIEETKLVRDMCKEYYSYVMGGHILDTLLGNYREEDDLVDYRTLPFKLF